MTQELPPPVELMQMLFGFAASRAIGVSAELRIADLLKDGAKTAEELAAANRCSCTFSLSGVTSVR